MDIITLFTLAVGLSMDAFAVSVCKGLATEKLAPKHMILAGLWFGGFQALMPVIGYFLGSQFKDKITSIDHWIAFFLLGFIGINMIRESREKGDSCPVGGMEAKKMFPLAVATSIDALAVGITFAFLEVNIILAASFIGITTFILSAAGVKVGNSIPVLSVYLPFALPYAGYGAHRIHHRSHGRWDAAEAACDA